jgi:hypothetical protein
MDEIVRRAMAKWPEVPKAFGWLKLDARGNWSVKTASGSFERISNPALVEFIGRNYECDGEGRWYFQNGPQRVYVTLAYAPFVYRLEDGLVAHTGKRAQELRGAWLDERGALVLETELGPGVLADRDLPRAVEAFVDAEGRPLDEAALAAIDAGQAWFSLGGTRVRVGKLAATDLAAKFGFITTPRPGSGEPEC